MTWLIFPLLAAAAYQLLALAGAIRHLLQKEPPAGDLPPVSILKPVRGLDPHFREAALSFLRQEYPEFEVIFGAEDPSDAALDEARELVALAPPGRVRITSGAAPAGNRKVGVLIELARHARHSLILITDSDVRVPPGYLRRIVAPLADSRVGLVTCLYGGVSDHWPGRWEALGLATDFAVSVLAARLLGVRDIGLGATLLVRAEDLKAMGGFEALADYIADDLQLAVRIAALGRDVILAKTPVETWLSGESWREVWRHQIRWARTIRVSKPRGYLGLLLSNGSFWSLAAALAGLGWPAAALLGLRVAAGLLVGGVILRSRDVFRYFYLIPLRDLWSVAVWAGGILGDTVEWRGRRLRLTPEGKITAY